MAFIEVIDLFKRFRKVVALDHIDLTVEEGEMLTLLGPSGCGKTTTLRCIAGLEKPDGGDIVIDGKSMLSQGFVPPSKRGIGMVFQNYAVWPHMKVFNNIVYGLKLQGASTAEIKERAQKVLELVGLEGLHERYPAQLSGGQQQRVALARALVRNPKVLLLDEPLSNLDAKLREKMRFEIKSLVRRMGITSVYVTHDQAEAMVISDRVVVMESGSVAQIGKPEEIYQTPASKFVADFIGTTNFLDGTAIEIMADTGEALIQTAFDRCLRCRLSDNQTAAVGQPVSISIRPEDVQLFTEAPSDQTNLYEGTISHRAYLGNFLYFFVGVMGVQIRVQALHHLPLNEGEEVFLYLNPAKCVILP
jgi:spermidine/putrescine ABC transporter ATP-binding subunit